MTDSTASSSTCPSCGGESPSGARFCMHCATPLPRRCAGCGSEVPLGARFCPQCAKPVGAPADPAGPTDRDPRAYTPKHLADKILQSKSALEGERKQVTVLFADVKGSMELAEQLDPEEWHRILDRFFAILTDGVHRLEGTVNQYTGDGIMALFGAPIAHEDHAQRACYAALHLRGQLREYANELRRTEGVSLSARIGLNSGEVIVGKIGDDLRMDYTAQGHTVGLAQRMEQTAAADTTYLTAHTAALVEGYFQLRDLGEFDLKGARAPLRVFELMDVGALRTRLDSSRSRGFSKFVGREREMTSLETALAGAMAGEGQVVGVVADAGTGKSRLCLEFVERCRARGIRVNAAHCPAHGKTVPYLPLLEMLRDIFEIDARDSDRDARRKITGELLLLDQSFASLLPILFDFMGVADAAKPAPSMSPEGRQQKLLAFVRHLVQIRSESEPTVLFLDDLHWIDPASDQFLAHSVEAAAQTQTLWLVNFRREYQAGWMSKSYYRQLPLRPLGAEAIAALLSDVLGDHPSVAELPARLHARTGGNPFFTEEIVQSLVESGSLQGARGAYRLVTTADTLEIPSTVQSVLAARLDRLPERDKRLLQTASVIGKEFAEPLLRRVVGVTMADSDVAAALDALGCAEFIYEAALYPEVEYAFKHPLTQEVAYHSLLSSRRSGLHAAVAGVIEEVDADRLDERAALLAYHWELAGEALTAAQWHARAAEHAGFDSPAEAARHWERVWGILERDTSSEEGAALRLRAALALVNVGWRLGMDRARVARVFSEGKALAVERGDARTQVGLHYVLGLSHSLSGEARRSIPILEEGVSVADATGDPELRWSARTAFDFSLWLLGDLGAALQMNDEQMALAEQDPGLGRATVGISTSDSLWHRGVILADMGRFDEAIDLFRRSQERAHHFGENEVATWVDFWLARALARAGDAPGARAMGRRAIESAEKIGSMVARVGGYAGYGTACVLSRDWAAARESLECALELTRERQGLYFLDPYCEAGLAEAYLGLGDEARASELADQAIETARRMQMAVAEVRAHLARARVSLALNGGDARGEFSWAPPTRGPVQASQGGATGFAEDAEPIGARSAHGGEFSKDIEFVLDTALDLVRSTGARSYEPQIHVERARLAALRSDTAGAQQCLREAHRLFTEMGAAGHARRVAGELGGA